MHWNIIMVQHEHYDNAALNDLLDELKYTTPNPSEALLEHIISNAMVVHNDQKNESFSSYRWLPGLCNLIGFGRTGRLNFESVGQLTAITGIIAAGIFGLWAGFYDINLGGLQANALITDSNDLLDPFVGLDFNYLESTS